MLLVPYLFLIYINDLCNIGVNGKIFSYADDTVLVVTSRYPRILKQLAQSNINKIAGWLSENRLIVNKEKTKYLIYGHQSPKLWDDMQLFLHNVTEIERAHEVKYLGVHFDYKLIWNKHLMNLNKKLRKLNYLFYYLKQYFSVEHLKRLYLALYQPILSYGIMHWGGAAKYHVKPIQMLQNLLFKFAFKEKNLISREHLLNIRELYHIQLLDYVFKNKPYVEKSASAYYTRSEGHGFVQVPQYNKYHSRIQAVYMGAKTYNSLPVRLRFDLRNFKKRRKPLVRYIKSRSNQVSRLLSHTNPS